MAKFLALAAIVASFGLAGPAAAQNPAVLGTDAAACHPGSSGTAVLVTVTGFKDRVGRLRIQNYTGNKGEYLESGKYLRRQEMPITAGGDMHVCLTLPGPGRYVVVALQDRDENGKLSPFSDGIGFTNNPRLGLSKPAAEKTLFTAGPGVTNVTIVLNYLRGLSVRPIAQK
ncbi:MAG: hypothetical protein CFE37_02910 [Alphaproteobacteria bacterium PA4]|nr:MAG: hypothetical protein CFE37_02910 [Alphaproteobacteria bacterium PA4]